MQGNTDSSRSEDSDTFYRNYRSNHKYAPVSPSDKHYIQYNSPQQSSSEEKSQTVHRTKQENSDILYQNYYERQQRQPMSVDKYGQRTPNDQDSKKGARAVRQAEGGVIGLKERIEGMNYKKLLESQIDKNQHLQRKIKNMEDKYLEVNLINQQLSLENEKLRAKIDKHSSIKQNLNKTISKLEDELKKDKNKIKNPRVDKQLEQKKSKEIYRLRQQNLKYQNFVEALIESIRILKGKKIKQLSQVWAEWKSVFESESLKKYRIE